MPSSEQRWPPLTHPITLSEPVTFATHPAEQHLETICF
jgi:hypothetical protein